ncbi:Hint domain-containing protein [Oleomonas cavernae]|uniref:Hint domain-containing protein n=1 Tax=Oleomonas cavernae TaxID=2320859 RepID=UPI0013146926|nr:Hint domain-containing protein [Oleomonas cavernae]
MPLKTRTNTVTRQVFSCEYAIRGCGKDTDHRGVTRHSEQTVTETQDVVTGRWVETGRSPWTVVRTTYSCPCDVAYIAPSAGGGHGGEAKGSRDTTGDGTTDSPGEGNMSDSSPNGVGSAAGVGHGVGGGGSGTGGAGDPNGGAVSCFSGETEITLADGSTKPISAIRTGDRVKSQKGTSQVIAIERPTLGGRLLYGLNGGPGFFTAEHPFMDAGGWVSVDPGATAEENPAVFVTKMKVGDWLVTIGQMEEWVVVKSIDPHDIDEPNRTVYNLILDGDHTYYADGYLVHNKY